MYLPPSRRPVRRRRRRHLLLKFVLLLVVVIGGVWAYRYFLAPTPVEKAVNTLQFDASVTASEKDVVRKAMKEQFKTVRGTIKVSAKTASETTDTDSAMILAAYVPVSDVYAARQSVVKADLAGAEVLVPADMDAGTRAVLAKALGLEAAKFGSLASLTDIPASAVAFVPADQLSPELKLLSFEGSYYLDSYQKGAVFRIASFGGGGAGSVSGLELNKYASTGSTLKVNQTGVTALTRVMMKKLATVKDPKYFSQHIGAFLADADFTHVSNEVSFKEGCQYHNASFCAPPEMIEVLKASGVDLVELTGNHNNDAGNQYNTETINLYHSLGWHTFGGGLNAAEAAKLFLADQKGSKVAFLGYNYADGPNSGAIARASTAGANPYSVDKLKADIATARTQANFIIVDVQFWECYAYPDGYVEYPQCDVPIGSQQEVFRQIIELGADMVIGTAAHQPQTYELYNGKPIYYGLGNLYFEQTSWPGTERGIILTHYFVNGKLIQTKLTPTVYHTELQTKIMPEADAVKLLERLQAARP